MSRDNGKIAVTAEFPVLGNVTGVRSLADVAAGRPVALNEDEPPVTYTEMDPTDATAAADGQARPGATPPSQTDAQAAPNSPAEDPAEDRQVDNEAAAAALLRLARGYVQAGLNDRAAEKCQEILDDYADTQAATEAMQLLVQCRGS